MTLSDVHLRLLRKRDLNRLLELMRDNREWLAEWEATHPSQSAARMPTRSMMRSNIAALLKAYRAGTTVPFVIELGGKVVGVLNVSGTVRGAVSTTTLGYWIAEEAAGKGIMPLAVAQATDHCFDVMGLHRVEICIRPENHKSLRVVQKLGFRYEGMRLRYIHIDGQWRDHECFALVKEDVPEGLLRRYLSAKNQAVRHTGDVSREV